MVTFLQMKLGQLIKDTLDTRKISQVDLAQRINVTPAQVSRIISGERGTSIDTLISIADALGLERDFVIKVAAGLPIKNGKSENDLWVEEQSHKLTLVVPANRPFIQKILDMSIQEDKPVIVRKTAKAKG